MKTPGKYHRQQYVVTPIDVADVMGKVVQGYMLPLERYEKALADVLAKTPDVPQNYRNELLRIRAERVALAKLAKEYIATESMVDFVARLLEDLRHNGVISHA